MKPSDSSIDWLLEFPDPYEARNVLAAAAAYLYREGECDEVEYLAVDLLDQLRYGLNYVTWGN